MATLPDFPPPTPITWVFNLMGKLEYVPGAPGQPGLHYRRDLAPGAAELVESVGGAPYLNYVCPCGCGVVGSLPLAPLLHGQPGWNWKAADDMRVRPVLRPSIARKFGCRWHGFLGGTPPEEKPGVWVTCAGWVRSKG